MIQPQGPPVRVWHEEVGDGPGIVMRHETVCPSCGASWVRPNTVRVSGSSTGYDFWCVECRVSHHGYEEEAPAATS